MKTLFYLLLLSALLPYQALAQCKLTVYSADGDKFWLVVQGQRINNEPLYNVELGDIMHEGLRVKVLFENQELAPADGNLLVASDDCNPCHVHYAIKKQKKGGHKISPANYIPISGKRVRTMWDEGQPGEGTEGSSPAQPSPKPTPTPTSSAPTPNTSTTVGTSGGSQGGSFSMNMTMGETGEAVNIGVTVSGMDGMGMGQGQMQTQTTVNQTSSSGNIGQATPTPAPAEPKAAGCSPTSASDLQSMKSAIDKQSFAEGKMRVAKQATKGRCLTVKQVITLMNLFSFEADKLSFAKYAYQLTSDKNNYYQVNEVFSFSSSGTELDEYIESQP
ncbi:MAG: DUF4476 domain-containing protein [Cytophagales bacterium]|nr:DUF4476 domain-containing protein [Cytophagales bacterium]